MSVPKEKRAGIEEILTYIPYFEQLDKENICRVVTEVLAEDGTMPVEHLMYRSPLLGFIEDTYVANVMIPHYLEVMNLEAMGEIELEVLVYGLEQASYELTMAVLTCIVVQEKYAKGMWKIAAEEGWFLMILRRLEQLMAEEQYN